MKNGLILVGEKVRVVPQKKPFLAIADCSEHKDWFIYLNAVLNFLS